jgi:hypothetical protein
MIINRPANFSPQRFSMRTLFLVVTIIAALLFVMKYTAGRQTDISGRSAKALY